MEGEPHTGFDRTQSKVHTNPIVIPADLEKPAESGSNGSDFATGHYYHEV